jgi:signal transduction histidine kinase
MRFWHKIFLGTLVLFIAAFDIGAGVLISRSSAYGFERERDAAVREQALILSSTSALIGEIYGPDDSDGEGGSGDPAKMLSSALSSYAEYYRSQGVLLAMYDDGAEIFSDIDATPGELAGPYGAGEKRVARAGLGEKSYLFVASAVEGHPDMTFVYARDISGLSRISDGVMRVFITINLIVCPLLGLFIFLLLHRFTRPIRELNDTTKDISDGDYTQRVRIESRDELGELAGTFNRMADAVEEKMALLDKAAKDRQTFIDDLAHEIKTPMTSIIGYSEYLMNARVSDEDRVNASLHIYKAAGRLNSLSAKLLTLSTIASGMELSGVDAEKLEDDIAGVMAPIMEEKGVTLAFVNEPEALRALRGDEDLLFALLKNLVENAVRASPSGGEVTVRVYRDGDGAPSIEVSDKGPGMTREEAASATEPFYRADKSRSRESGGAGLGLSICRKIADAHDARLEIDSGPGRGTAVRVHFTSA